MKIEYVCVCVWFRLSENPRFMKLGQISFCRSDKF